tara:strand:- start:605 stop:862 length:258 start_codon:yes stop_codon:yes gene_type:complete
MEKQIEQLEIANKFLQGIAESQCVKIRALEKEIHDIKQLGSGGCSILDTLPDKELEKLKSMAISENLNLCEDKDAEQKPNDPKSV